MVVENMSALLLLTLMCISRLRSSSVKFISERNKRLDHVLYSLSARSSIECCHECLRNGACTAVSYSPRLKMCELNDDQLIKNDSISYDVYFRNNTNTSGIELWDVFQDHKYLVASIQMSWSESEDYCEALGSHLVDIYSKDEDSFVRSLANAMGHTSEYIWIGMEITWPHQQMELSTGMFPSYQNFMAGEPNENSLTESCVAMAPNEDWIDTDCTQLRASVCKKPV